MQHRTQYTKSTRSDFLRNEKLSDPCVSPEVRKWKIRRCNKSSRVSVNLQCGCTNWWTSIKVTIQFPNSGKSCPASVPVSIYQPPKGKGRIRRNWDAKSKRQTPEFATHYGIPFLCGWWLIKFTLCTRRNFMVMSLNFGVIDDVQFFEGFNWNFVLCPSTFIVRLTHCDKIWVGFGATRCLLTVTYHEQNNYLW